MKHNILEVMGNNQKSGENVLGSIKRNMFCSARRKFISSRGGITLLLLLVFVLPYLLLDQVTTTLWDTSKRNSINKISMDKDATKSIRFIIDEAVKLYKPTFDPRQEIIRESVRNGLLHPLSKSANAVEGNQVAEVKVNESKNDEKREDLVAHQEDRERSHEKVNSGGGNNEAQMYKIDNVLEMRTSRNQGSLGE